MTDKPDGKRWDWRPLTGIVAVLTIYALSTGPVCRLCFDYHCSDKALPYVYWPIWQVSRLSEPGKATAFYLSLWGSSWRAEYWNQEHGVVVGGRSAKVVPDP
jgi:hypothetical protein